MSRAAIAIAGASLGTVIIACACGSPPRPRVCDAQAPERRERTNAVGMCSLDSPPPAPPAPPVEPIDAEPDAPAAGASDQPAGDGGAGDAPG